MSELTLVIGNKNISSWSFRPWILLKQSGISFQEIPMKLYTPEYSASIDKYSPSGKVPVLNDSGLQIWDSLSISEYLAEKFPEKELWPKDTAARAQARSIVAEMHSGFSAMRTHLGMNYCGRFNKEIPADALKDITRVQAIWTHCLESHGGPFLFGKKFGIADAFYTPVVSRFLTYGVELSPKALEYVNTISGLVSYQFWGEGAKAEVG
ncbi:glutathione S-transferase family protein [Leptospira semungkisensis]|uniref:Glutathione S-transferase family protein n=1 Tax=Leptospira semungkisensis TaxID=2484985 RepID=A0A4R9G7K2_9LEPT|nr:glutathione S-transferase family protein [Leptospira semungkisensis]TGK07602.1 glutathione S-transferase family protein [Leptospira semungkisensis]